MRLGNTTLTCCCTLTFIVGFLLVIRWDENSEYSACCDFHCRNNSKMSYFMTQKKLALIERAARKQGIVLEESLDIPKIYVVTPTYARYAQYAELTRFSHTLMLVPNLHWIVIEDAEQQSPIVEDLLHNTGISYTHLNIFTPAVYKKKPNNTGKGVLQRNLGLSWLRSNVQDENGVVYFADDDNSYTLRLFEEIRTVKKVGVWPVGLAGGLLVERAQVNEFGKVAGWFVAFMPNRTFPIDMAGFAINLKLINKYKDAKFEYKQSGWIESNFLAQIVKGLEELEPKASYCSKVLVWHTRTQEPNLQQEKKFEGIFGRPSHLSIDV